MLSGMEFSAARGVITCATFASYRNTRSCLDGDTKGIYEAIADEPEVPRR